MLDVKGSVESGRSAYIDNQHIAVQLRIGFLDGGRELGQCGPVKFVRCVWVRLTLRFVRSQPKKPIQDSFGPIRARRVNYKYNSST